MNLILERKEKDEVHEDHDGHEEGSGCNFPISSVFDYDDEDFYEGSGHEKHPNSDDDWAPPVFEDSEEDEDYETPDKKKLVIEEHDSADQNEKQPNSEDDWEPPVFEDSEEDEDYETHGKKDVELDIIDHDSADLNGSLVHLGNKTDDSIFDESEEVFRNLSMTLTQTEIVADNLNKTETTIDGRFMKKKLESETTVDLYFEETTVVQLKDPEDRKESPTNQIDVDHNTFSSSNGFSLKTLQILFCSSLVLICKIN